LHPGQKDNVVLADIGANMLNIAVISRGLPMIIKDEPGGGQYLTNEIADMFDLELADAEAIKFGSIAPPDPGRAAEVVDRAVGNWIAAVERVIDAARGDNPSYRASAIYLSGGSSLIQGLPEEFEKYFGLRAERLNPITSLSYNAKKYDPAYLDYIGPQLAVSFGLALRKVEVE
jgi:type IV pilus assembly protein PilM